MHAEDDAALVLDIVSAAREACAFARGLDLETFRQDSKTYSAVLYQAMIIGEAAKNLSPAFSARTRTCRGPRSRVCGIC